MAKLIDGQGHRYGWREALIYPAEFFEPAPSVGVGLKVWDGSAWTVKPVKYWTGSAWVTKPIKRWSGSAWL
jgi:hypothetical protein